jgi:hypothetical protein
MKISKAVYGLLRPAVGGFTIGSNIASIQNNGCALAPIMAIVAGALLWSTIYFEKDPYGL